MSIVKMAIRGVAVCLLGGGGGMYALNSGLVPGLGSAPDNQPVEATTTLFSASTAHANTTRTVAQTHPAPHFTTPPVSPAIPVTASGSLVSLPDADPSTLTLAQAIAPARPIPPTITAPGAQEIPAAVSEFGLPCDVTVNTSAVPGALIALDVMAPCQPEARVVIEHSGLTLTGRTDALGLMVMDLPAFESPAYLSVRLPEGDSQSALVHVPDLADYDRVAVQWEQDRQLMLHAIPASGEFGAPGHIWEETPGSYDDVIDGTAGVLMHLGSADVENPMQAQVVTYPRAAITEDDPITLSVDAPITETTCGQPVEARAIEVLRDGMVDVVPMTLTLPDCDAVGDYLVLQNIFADLTVASN